jgi:hypothetical protein
MARPDANTWSASGLVNSSRRTWPVNGRGTPRRHLRALPDDTGVVELENRRAYVAWSLQVHPCGVQNTVQVKLTPGSQPVFRSLHDRSNGPVVARASPRDAATVPSTANAAAITTPRMSVRVTEAGVDDVEAFLTIPFLLVIRFVRSASNCT